MRFQSLKQPTSSEDNRQVSPIKNVLKTYSRIRKEVRSAVPVFRLTVNFPVH